MLYRAFSLLLQEIPHKHKGPTMDLVFYVSAIKIDDDGLFSMQEQYVLRHHVKCK